MRRTLLLTSTLCLACALVPPVAAGDDASPTGILEVEFRSGPYRMSEEPDGIRIEMEGFGHLKDPGRPMLPEKEYLVLLPPGARALSVQVQEIDGRTLPGGYAVVPAPSLLPMVGVNGSAELLKRETERRVAVRRAAYASDASYPAAPARIVGSGSLRKYSYVRVAYYPFTYQPVSQRLVHRSGVKVSVHYTLPTPGGEVERYTRGMLPDTVADDRASELFVNYGDLKNLYEPGETLQEGDFEIHDYVIITTPDLVAAVNASGFVAWKSSIGFSVRTVLTTDPEITGQTGGDLAEQIRNFLRANYGSWGIEHVLIVGNYMDVPMRYCYPDPENHLHDPSNPGVGPGSVPTDLYYADLSLPDADSWDLDGDGYHGEYGEDQPDFLAEVSVGRVPTGIASRITYTLDKMVRFEQDTGAWKRNALHASAVLFYENQDFSEVPFRDGAVVVAEIEGHFMQGWTLSRYAEQAGLSPSTYPWPQITLTAFITDWNSGMYGFVNWAGHGWPDQVARTIWDWDDGDGVPETDGSDSFWSDPFIRDYPVLQDDYPSIVCAVSCDVGYPDPNPFGNMGVHLLTDPGTGAAAGIVSSTRYAAVSSDWPAQPGGAESLCYEFNRYLIAAPGGLRTVGEALYESKFFSHLHYGWDRHYEYRNQYNYNLYGDPAMDWRGAGTRTGNLLRNTDVTSLDPVAPPLANCLPLDPADDLHVADFVSGDVDPDSGNGSPLVFYSVDAPVWLYVTRTPAGEIKIEF